MRCRFRMLIFQDLEGLTEAFGGMSAGMSGPKLPLWAEFSYRSTIQQGNPSLYHLKQIHANGVALYKTVCFFLPSRLLEFRRVTIRGAQPSARLSKEICLSEGSARVSPRVLRGSAGFSPELLDRHFCLLGTS